ncbi:MAG: SHOCT domain-containing protein [Spirochaetaceae bacterium]|nr:SHOCT domain-containing protein [Spirochaetaceae bacterium]
MKQIFIAFFLLLSLSAFAKPSSHLFHEISADGTVIIDNEKHGVEDRIHVQNDTGETLDFVIAGIARGERATVLSNIVLKPKESRFLTTAYDDDLDDFYRFRVYLKNGTIALCSAQRIKDDLYIVISKVNIGAAPDVSAISSDSISSQDATTTEADELRKWKALLDDGIITQDEFNAKKKQLLGL